MELSIQERLKDLRVDNSLLCELAANPDFVKRMAGLEIYANGTAVKQMQGANAIVDAMNATIVKQYNPDISGLGSVLFIQRGLSFPFRPILTLGNSVLAPVQQVNLIEVSPVAHLHDFRFEILHSCVRAAALAALRMKNLFVEVCIMH